VIGGESGVKLLEAGGKEHLKDDLRKALAQRVPEVKVADILFTEFLVQQ
jgi:flagellar FliL protein